MRYPLLFTIAILVFTGCKKDKYTTVPQIKFEKLSHNAVDLSINSATPIVTFSITDAEGDLGINANDTAFIYMKNLLTNDFDSVPFPDLQTAAKNNFKADIDVTITKVLKCKSQPGNPLHIDTLYFEFYVKDFAKNKSNVFTTPEPVYFECR
jgi:hypothetical protein